MGGCAAWISVALVVVWLFLIIFSSYESVNGFAGCDASLRRLWDSFFVLIKSSLWGFKEQFCVAG